MKSTVMLCSHSDKESYKNLGQSESHGDWTDPAAVQTLSLTQQQRNTFIWSHNKHQLCWVLSLFIFGYDFSEIILISCYLQSFM